MKDRNYFKDRSQKGFLAFDFLVGFMLISSFFILMAILCFTLSVVESMQYIAFATSRTYYAADVTLRDQREAAQAKYAQLTEDTPAFQTLLRDDWFGMEDPVIGHPPENNRFDGVQINFTARVLAFELPFFLGSTGDENDFEASVNSYIGREPSMEECDQDLAERRKDAILNLDARYQNYGSEMDGAYFYAGDNGC